MPRKRLDASEKRLPKTISLHPDVVAKLDAICGAWRLSDSQIVERAIEWYADALEKDPTLMKPPKPTEP